MKIKNLLEEAQRGIYFPAGCSPRLVDLLESIPVETGVDQITSFLQLLKEWQTSLHGLCYRLPILKMILSNDGIRE